MAEMGNTTGTGTETGTTGTATEPQGTIAKTKAHAASLVGEAGTMAKDMAEEGKVKAGEALTTVAKIVSNAADFVEEKAGSGLGGYARRAADEVNGVAQALQTKSVDELVEDSRQFVRRSPALALGGAIAVGFLLARVARIAAEAAETGLENAERSLHAEGTSTNGERTSG